MALSLSAIFIINKANQGRDQGAKQAFASIIGGKKPVFYGMTIIENN